MRIGAACHWCFEPTLPREPLLQNFSAVLKHFSHLSSRGWGGGGVGGEGDTALLLSCAVMNASG